MKLIKYFILTVLVFIYIFLPNNSYASSGFDFPLGPPDGVGYLVENTGGLNFLDRHDYQGDGVAEFHPGEDWNEARNGKDYGNDNKDLNDPIYSIADGKVVYASFHSAGWGNLVLIEHNLDGIQYWSQYGHLSKLGSEMTIGKNISKGTIIGNVGSFPYGTKSNIHLHFEIRKKYRKAYEFVMNWPKEKVLEYYLCPTDFIDSHRAPKGSTLTITSESNMAKLSWTKAEDSDFESYELFRSNVPNGTNDPNKRTSVFKSEDQNILAFADNNHSPGIYYYRLLTKYKNGLSTESEEVSITINQEIQRITNNTAVQRGPAFAGKRLVWEDLRSENGTWPKKLYYYDLETKKLEDVSIGVEGAKRPLDPAATKNYVVFYAQDNSYNSTGMNIYCYDFNEKTAFPITKASGEQFDPVVSDDGIVIWTDMRNGNADLYYLDVKKSEGEKPFVVERGVQVGAKISGDKVVWRDSRSGNNDLYYKKLGGNEKIIAQNLTTGGGQDIWENWVVWISNKKLSLMNLETEEVKVLMEKDVITTAIKDGKVAYSKYEGKDIYIYVYDIASGKTAKINQKTTTADSIAVSGNNLAFTSGDPENPSNQEIYLANI